MPADRSYHCVLLVLAAAVLVAAFVLQVRDQRVLVPVLDRYLPESCLFKSLLNFGCPGCGLTRSFIHIAHGQPADAWRMNPAGIFAFVLVASQVPYRLVQLWRIRQQRAELRLFRLSTWLAAALGVLLISQWIVRLAIAMSS